MQQDVRSAGWRRTAAAWAAAAVLGLVFVALPAGAAPNPSNLPTEMRALRDRQTQAVRALDARDAAEVDFSTVFVPENLGTRAGLDACRDLLARYRAYLAERQVLFETHMAEQLALMDKYKPKSALAAWQSARANLVQRQQETRERVAALNAATMRIVEIDEEIVQWATAHYGRMEVRDGVVTVGNPEDLAAYNGMVARLRAAREASEALSAKR